MLHRLNRIIHPVCCVVLILTMIAFAAAAPRKTHRDYVPDEKTAERIADAVLVGQFGEERVKSQRPLLVDGSNKEYWIVQGAERKSGLPVTTGGGLTVWINKHSGCIEAVMEHMK